MPDIPAELEFFDYDTRVAAYALIVDEDRILLSWWNGEGHSEPAWSLPGGGVDLPETVGEGTVREVREETGFDVELIYDLRAPADGVISKLLA